MPEVITFACTIEAWQTLVVATLQTGLTNARTEGCDRIVKHVGRIAFGSTTSAAEYGGPAPADHGESHQPAPMPPPNAKSR